jgi:hypothetical protein
MSESFLKKRFPAKHPDDPLSKQAIAIRFRGSVDKKLRSIPEYSTLIRDAVDEYFARLENPVGKVVTTALQQHEAPSDIPLPKIDDDGRPMEKLGTRVPASVHEVVQALPHRAEWLRQVITEATQRELMAQEP